MIETERLLLRPYGIDDFGFYWSMLSEPTARFPSRQQLSREDAWQRILAAAGHWSLFGYGLFAVIEKSTGDYVGETGLMNMRRELGERFADCDEAGWYLKSKAQGRGLGIEAARATHDWHERHFGGQTTFCIVDRVNTPSLNLAAKLGYEVADTRTCGKHELLVFERASGAARKESFHHAPGPREALH